jgi:lysyl-tRNA synthetase class 2
VVLAGRMMLKREAGKKAAFATLQDSSGPRADGRIQIYVTLDNTGEEAMEALRGYDLGDILGVEGTLFKTKTDELTIKVTKLRLITKSLRPLPDKFHGLADQETKYRQRYVDLIMNEETRRTFKARTAAMSSIRRFMQERTSSWKSRRRCCTPSRAAPRPSLSSPTTTRSTCRCSCASRRSCT